MNNLDERGQTLGSAVYEQIVFVRIDSFIDAMLEIQIGENFESGAAPAKSI